MSNPSTDDLAAWFAATRNALARAQPRIETDRRFGAEGLKVNGRVFAMLVKGRRVVKLPATRVSALVEQGRGSHFDPRSRRANCASGTPRCPLRTPTVVSGRLLTALLLAGVTGLLRKT